MKLIIWIHLRKVGKVPCASFIHQRLGSGSGIKLSLLIEISLRGILQDTVSHLQCFLLMRTLLLLDSWLKVLEDVIHVVEAVTLLCWLLSYVLSLSLSVVIPAVSRSCSLRVFECGQLLNLGSGYLRVQNQWCFGIYSMGTSDFHGNQVFLAIRTTAGLDRIIMKIFSEGWGRVLLELGCLQPNSWLWEEILQSRRLLINRGNSEVLRLLPLTSADLVNPELLLRLPRFQVEWRVTLERHYI